VSKRTIVLIGGGGHCKACIDVLERDGTWQVAGIVDRPDRLHEKVLGYEVIAADDDLQALVARYEGFLVTVGHTRTAAVRIRLFEQLKKLNAPLASVVSPLAHVSPHAHVGEGTIVMHHAVINAAARVGNNCIINSMALVEHDAVVGNHTHVSTGARVNGECLLGAGVFVGSGAVLLQGVQVAAGTVIGAGAVVTESISTRGTYVGCPARLML
jgi:sugar O-acyltransferase (sialic acid O-acetyltransferase NeuD family)